MLISERLCCSSHAVSSPIISHNAASTLFGSWILPGGSPDSGIDSFVVRGTLLTRRFLFPDALTDTVFETETAGMLSSVVLSCGKDSVGFDSCTLTLVKKSRSHCGLDSLEVCFHLMTP